jgi:hypothetical protein
LTDPARRRPPRGLFRGLKLGAAALLMGPLAVSENPKSDSSETSVFVGGGTGSYAFIHRGCEGPTNKFKVDYLDAGASVEHAFRGPARLGIRGGAIWPQDAPSGAWNAYANPHAALEWKFFSAGIGGVISKKTFPYGDETIEPTISAHLRVGRLDKVYVSSSWFENVPVYSGGGFFDLGLGGRPARSFDLWIGVSGFGPYDGGGVLVKSAWRASPALALVLQGRLGSSEGIEENALSLGFRWRARGRARDGSP